MCNVMSYLLTKQSIFNVFLKGEYVRVFIRNTILTQSTTFKYKKTMDKICIY